MPTIARTAASLAGITAVFALVLYLAYGGGGGDSPTTPTPSAIVRTTPTATSLTPETPAATPRPFPAVLDDTDVSLLEVRSLVQFPSNTAFVLETGCWQCDGPSTGLRRMYKDADGEVRIDQLLSLEQLGLPPDAYFTGYAIAADASFMLASVCVRGGCAYGISGWTADARSAVFESIDGGVTWRSDGEYDLALTVHGLVSDEEALVSWQIDEDDHRGYALYPGFTKLVVPGDAAWPVLALGGEVLWSSVSDPGRILGPHGSTFVDFGESTYIHTYQSWRSSPDDVLVVNWSWFPGTGVRGNYMSLVDRFGEITATYELNPPDAGMLSTIWYGGQIYGTMANPPLILPEERFLGLLPAILDLETGRYNNIKEPFLEDGYEPQRDIIRAVQSAPYDGPIARVVGLDRSCLNVRGDPDVESEILTCAADGVLLRAVIGDDGEPSVEDGEWIWVYTPDGFLGWAATEYLEY